MRAAQEIVDHVKENCSSQDRADLNARVFRGKLEELMKDITKRHAFGRCVAFTQVIEFQKR